jgi:hypothetical protein
MKNAIGRYLVRIPLGDGFMETIADVRSVFVDQLNIKRLSIQPRCVIVNKYESRLTFRQQGYLNLEMSLDVNERKPFYWFSEGHPKFLQIHFESKDEVLLSGYFNMNM